MAVTSALIQRRGLETASALTPDRIETVISKAPLEDGVTKAEIKTGFQTRLEHLSLLAEA